MLYSHEIFRQVGYIQQTLSQNKKPIGIFLAAGCPLSVRVNHIDVDTKKEIDSPLIPDIAGLTEIILKKLKATKDPSDCDKLVGQMISDGIPQPNIEQILSQIRALRQVAGKVSVRDFTAAALDCLDKEICEIITFEVDKPLTSDDSPYHGVAAWAKSIERDKPVHLFTTNYDLLIEQAFEEEGCPYFDGFIGARKAFFDLRAVEEEGVLNPRWARLWKIHGSINWRLDEKKNVVRSDRKDGNQSYLIYPSHLKYDQSRKMPYLAMLDRLKSFLLAPSCALFIVGYSFSDDHINDIILQSLRSNPTAIIYACLFGDLEQPKYEKAIQCSKSTSNLSLIAFDKGIIGRKMGTWDLKERELLNQIPGGIVNLINVQDEVDGKVISSDKFELRLGDFKYFGDFLKEISASKKYDYEKNSE